VQIVVCLMKAECCLAGFSYGHAFVQGVFVVWFSLHDCVVVTVCCAYCYPAFNCLVLYSVLFNQQFLLELLQSEILELLQWEFLQLGCLSYCLAISVKALTSENCLGCR